MRKITTVLVFAMVMILTGVAHAEILKITDGRLLGDGFDTFAMFSGDGFSALLSARTGFSFRRSGRGRTRSRPRRRGWGLVTVGGANYSCQSDPLLA
jgi:hypothetical protein